MSTMEQIDPKPAPDFILNDTDGNIRYKHYIKKAYPVHQFPGRIRQLY